MIINDYYYYCYFIIVFLLLHFSVLIVFVIVVLYYICVARGKLHRVPTLAAPSIRFVLIGNITMFAAY